MSSVIHTRCYEFALGCVLAAFLGLVLTACDGGKGSAESGASGRALLEAVQMGDNKRVAMLLDEGAFTEVRSEKGDTPLLFAVKTGNLECVRMILNSDADRDVRSGDGKGPAELALDSGNYEMLRFLTEHGILSDEVAHDGNPLLFKAVRLKDRKATELLLDNGANPNAEGKEGRRALHVAVENILPDFVDQLIESGADINACDDMGAPSLWLALQITKSRDRGMMVEKLLKAGAEPGYTGEGTVKLLQEVVRRGMFEEAVKLINFGADVNGQSNDADSPLAIAHAKNDLAMMEMLLSRGADGSFLLDSAIDQEDADLLNMLFDAGVSLTRWSESQSDGLVASCVRRSAHDLAELYLRHGADAEAMGLEKQSPLHMAVAMRDTAMVRLLLHYGANPNKYFARPASESFLKLVEKESMRWFLSKERRLSPLMMAANNGDPDMITSLLKHGAKKYIYSGRYRMYPVNFASRRSDVKSMQAILGQDPNNEKMHAVLDLSEQRVRLYDRKGEIIFSSRVSTGKRGFRTPTGSFVITDKHRHHRSTIYGSSMPYFQRLSCGAFGFHSGHCPGYPASHGCIRMPYSSAKKLFDLTPVGTRVIIQK